MAETVSKLGLERRSSADSSESDCMSGAYDNVWSASLLQAKSEGDQMVCANVCGLHWSVRLLAMMECAALSSY
jgi:hypothetical protein